MKKSLKKSIGIVLAALVAVGGLLAGGSFYMLSYALRPDAVMAEKNASSYEYMYAEYPFLAEWADSLRSSGALRDTVIVGDGGEPRRPNRPTGRRSSSTATRTTPCGC